jgi:hypothetical protein
VSSVVVEFVIRPEEGPSRRAQAFFATLTDLKSVKNWRQQIDDAKDILTEDALEFASEACKRWMFYRSRRRTASSVKTIGRRISADKKEEVAFLLVAREESALGRCLGIALCRRTWANHVVLDFLATHPIYLRDGPDRVRGIGKGLLFAICEIGHSIGATALWGEATESSAPKYKAMFRLDESDDLFYVRASNLSAFRAAMAAQIETESLRQQ